MIDAWLLSIIASGSGLDPVLTFETLESATPADLARLIPDAAAPPGTWIEKRTTRIQGVAQWRGINVELAAAPRATGRRGLCAADTASGFFAIVSDGTGRLVLDRRERATRYKINDRDPSMNRAEPERPTTCDGRVLSADGAKDLSITAGKVPANVQQAAFAVRVIATALTRPVRCRNKEADLCAGIAPRSLDLRQMYRLSLQSCDDAPRRWCVRGQWDRPRGDGPVLIEADTGVAVDADLDTVGIRFRKVRLTTEFWPIA